jgi:nucleoside phosphorylase/DNA polymerase III delta prime subunit
LVLVGIAGAKPENEFGLGDVVVATRLQDFCVTAALRDGGFERDIRGGRVHPVVHNAIVNLPALKTLLKDWNSEEAIGRPLPPVRLAGRQFHGSDSWKKKVKKSLVNRFGPDAEKRQPLVIAAAVGAGNVLMKDPGLLEDWLANARDLKAVEMELSGVYEAARRVEGDIPVLAIRGISDVVGFDRDPTWTEYACHSAASFAQAFLAADLLKIERLQKMGSAEGHGSPRSNDASPKPALNETKLHVAAVYYELVPPIRPEDADILHAKIRSEFGKVVSLAQAVRGDVSYFVAEDKAPVRAAVQLAIIAADIVDNFSSWSREICGLKLSGNIRFAITAGEVRKLSFSGPFIDDIGHALETRYWGQLLDVAQARLHEIRPAEVAVTAIADENLRRLVPKFRKTGTDDDAYRLYHRLWAPDPTHKFEIRADTINEMKKPLLAGAKADELRSYEPPKTFPDIRRALLDNGLIILRGEPGTGKSLSALRLAAELYQEDRRVLKLPRGSRRLWSMLNDERLEPSVILFDDAFGKISARPRAYLDTAKEQLKNFLKPRAPVAGNRCVILTVRTTIWEQITTAWNDPKLTKLLSEYLVDFTKPEDMGAVFERLCEAHLPEATQKRPWNWLDIQEKLASSIREKLKKPIDVKDYFDFLSRNMSKNIDFLLKKVEAHQVPTKDRYMKELSDYLPSKNDWRYRKYFIYLFLAHVFGNAFTTQRQLQGLLFELVTKLGEAEPTLSGAEKTLWRRCADDNIQWGRWSAGEDFKWQHPLREEVLVEFLASEAAREAIERLFACFSQLNKMQELAFAVPKIGGHLGPQRRNIVERLAGENGERRDSPPTLLANATGYALSALSWPAVRLDRESVDYLIARLQELLKRRDYPAAAAVAAICDGYREGADTGLPPLSDTELPDLICELARDPLSSRDVKVQTAWAIISNFGHLPSKLTDLAFEIASSDENEWVRLRSLEALFDYYEEISVDKYAHSRLDEVLGKASLNDESIAVRRGLAAAYDATFEYLSDDLKRCLLEMANDRTALDVIEWFSWACGEHFSDERDHGLLDGDQNPLRSLTEEVFSSLALHEDARVRMWIARALAEEGIAPKKSKILSEVLARLADDPNEQVLAAAGLVFQQM